MKIYVLPVGAVCQPDEPAGFPPHHDGYGVENDLTAWFQRHPEYITLDPDEADWHYLPVFWSACNALIKMDSKKQAVQRDVDKHILNPSKTFTVCQPPRGPLVDLNSKITIFLCNMPDGNYEFGLHHLCKHHTPSILQRLFLRRKYKASFVGRFSTSFVRSAMFELLKERKDVYILDGILDQTRYIRNLLESYVALAPRGVGANSYRFYEAMQLGIAPMLVSYEDTRPFKKYIPWADCSLFSTPENIAQTLDELSNEDFITMGKRAKQVYYSMLDYGKWPMMLLKQLGDALCARNLSGRGAL